MTKTLFAAYNIGVIYIDNQRLDRLALAVKTSWSDRGATELLHVCEEMVHFHSRHRVPGIPYEDVAQKLRLEVFVALDRWDPARGSFGPRVERFLRWEVSRLIHHMTTAQRRVQINCGEYDDNMVVPSHDCMTGEEAADRRRQILDRLETVSVPVRETATLILLGLPYSAVAQQQHITVGGVADRMRRFREGLRWTR